MVGSGGIGGGGVNWLAAAAPANWCADMVFCLVGGPGTDGVGGGGVA